MTLARWKTVESLFYEALGKDGEERRLFLEALHRRDDSLYQEVESLLAHHRPGDPLREDGVRYMAHLLEPAPIWKEGDQVGSYQIVSLLGKGGMGEVYLAWDRQLGRKVALKTLSRSLTDDQGLVDRLKREAQSASVLNHPNILTIFEFGQQGETHYIASEFVDGVSLRDRIGHLSVADAVSYARQIGLALQALHAAGILHRDIKPENIMIRQDGYVKVLDFGLAKLAQPRPENRKGRLLEQLQLDSASSVPGLIMGTIHYMSPEQVRGQVLDQRTDVWSWGVVVYEMLSGRQPFEAATPGDVLAAILDKEPGAPTADKHLDYLNHLVMKCLAKQPADRYQTMTAALLELDQAAGSPAAPVGPEAIIRNPKAPPARNWLNLGKGPLRTKSLILWSLLLVVAAGVLTSVYHFSRRAYDRPLRIASMTRLTVSGNVTASAISPDGNYVAYATEDSQGQALRIRQLKTNADALIVTPEAVQFTGMTFSGDGQFVYYVAESGPLGILYRVPVLGGTPRKILEDVDSPVSFSPDGKRFAFLRNDAQKHEFALLVRSLEGGPETNLASLGAPQTLGPAPVWSPDGQFVLCGIITGFTPGAANVKILSVRVQDGQQHTVGPLPWYWMGRPVWLEKSRAIALAANDIHSNRSQLVEVSWPEGVVSTITHDTQSYSDLDSTADFARLVAVQSDRLSTIWIVNVEEPGEMRRLTQAGGRFYGVTWTKSGKLVSQTDIGGHPDLWSIDSRTGEMRQITDDEYVEELPQSSPDGKYLVYASNRDGSFHIWRASQDGSEPARLTSDTAHEQNPEVTPDGQSVVFTSTRSGFLSLWRVPIQGGTPTPITHQGSKKPAISPDGSRVVCSYYDPAQGWVTAILRLSDGRELASFKDPTSEVPVRWSADGKHILYVRTENGVSNIWVQAERGGRPKQLTHFTEERIFSFAMSPDGKSLACIRGLKTSDVVVLDVAR